MFDYDRDDSPAKSDTRQLFWGIIAALLFVLVILVFAPKNVPHAIEKPNDYNIKDGTFGGIVVPMPACCDRAKSSEAKEETTNDPIQRNDITSEPEAAPAQPSPEESTVTLDIPAAIEQLHEHIHERIHEDAQTIVRHVEQDVTEAKSIIHRVLSARRLRKDHEGHRPGQHGGPASVFHFRAHVARLHRGRDRHALTPPPITYFYDPAEDPSRIPYIRYWVE